VGIPVPFLLLSILFALRQRQIREIGSLLGVILSILFALRRPRRRREDDVQDSRFQSSLH